MPRISSLTGELILDINKWTSGIKQVERDSRALEKSLKPISDFADKAGKAMLAVGASITGTFTAMTIAATNYGAELADASQRTGITTEALSKLKFAASQSGASFEEVTIGLRALSKNAAEAAQGTKSQADAFRAVGISVKDAQGNLRPMDQLLGDLADRFSKMSDGTQKAALAQEIFGKGGAALIPVLNEGREGIAALGEEAQRLGLVIGSDTAKASKQFNDDLDKVKNAVLGLSVSVGKELLPALIKMSETLVDAIASFRRFSEAHPELIKAVGALGVALVGAGGVVYGLGKMAGAISDVIALSAQLAPHLSNLTALTIKYGAALGSLPWASAIAGATAWGAAIAAAAILIGDTVSTLKSLKEAQQSKNRDEILDRQNTEKMVEVLRQHGQIIDKVGKSERDYNEEVRKATQSLFSNADAVKKVSDANEDLLKKQRRSAEVIDEAKAALKELLENEKAAQQRHEELVRKGTAEIARIQEAALDSGLKAYQDMLAAETSADEQHFKTALQAIQDQARAQIKSLDVVTGALQHQADEEARVQQQINEETESAFKYRELLMKQATDARLHEIDKQLDAIKKQADEEQRQAERTRQVWATAVGNITSDFAKGFADIIFEGRKFSDTMKDIAKNTAKAMFEAFLTGLLAPLTSKLASLGGLLADKLGGIFGGGAGAGGGILGGAASAGGGVLGGVLNKGGGPGAGGLGSIGLLQGLAFGGIGAGINLVAGAIGSIGAGREAADKIVKAQNALADTVSGILNDAGLSAENKSKQIENLWSAFQANALAFAQGGSRNADVTNQAFATLLPWITRIQTDLAKQMGPGGSAPSSVQTQNVYNFTINLSESKNARATGALIRDEIIPAIVNAIQNNTGGLTQAVTIGVKNSLAGVVTTA